ncbi:hypothetical protein C8Q74DRAFT_386228 [Fomes fomentarius]|nr:hypothetical protein C8Q74DRAFT_386228 [Fomes fomentarius]
MWTSDSIHLRRILYIPVDKTRHAKQLRTTLIELTLNPSSTSSSIHSGATVFDTNTRRPTTIDHELSDVGKLTIRRVPASQLSFFPPSNHPPHLEGCTSARLPANGRTSRDRPALPVSFTRSNESPLQGILDVFSSSLHITAHHLRQSSGSLFGNGNGGGGTAVRAPTTLASRLSLESNSGTPSSTSDDFDWEHEMEVVSTSKIVRRTGTGTGNVDAAARTRKRSHHARQASASLNDLHTSLSTTAQDERDSVELDAGPFTGAAISQSPPHTPTHSRSSSSRSQAAITPPSNSSVVSRGRGRRIVPYVIEGEALEEWRSPRGPRGKSVVRTAQLEPSPGMQFPLKPRTGTNPTDST